MKWNGDLYNYFIPIRFDLNAVKEAEKNGKWKKEQKKTIDAAAKRELSIKRKQEEIIKKNAADYLLQWESYEKLGSSFEGISVQYFKSTLSRKNLLVK